MCNVGVAPYALKRETEEEVSIHEGEDVMERAGDNFLCYVTHRQYIDYVYGLLFRSIVYVFIYCPQFVMFCNVIKNSFSQLRISLYMSAIQCFMKFIHKQNCILLS